MTQASSNSIVLESLAEGIPVIASGCHHMFLERCLFCLDSEGHQSGIVLDVSVDDHKTERSDQFSLQWSTAIDDSLRMRNADKVRSTEHSACALAFLLVRELTTYTAIQEATRGTTVDYYLSDKDRNDDLIFNHTARLEVSGIARGDESLIKARIKSKLDRLKGSDLPIYIVVVEHGVPVARMVIRL